MATAAVLAVGAIVTAPAAEGVETPSARPSATDSARTITVCIDRRTRETRVLLRGRCRAGEKKQTWPRRPPTGAAGTAGAAGATGPVAVRYLRAADGRVLGQFVATAAPGIPVYAVLVDGGLYYYYGSGQPIAGSGGAAQFTDPACAGAPVRRTGPDAFPATVNVATALSGVVRFVRGGSGSAITAAYRATGASTPVNPGGLNLYSDDGSGCLPLGGNPYTTGTLWSLEPVAAPPTGPGPVTIGP